MSPIAKLFTIINVVLAGLFLGWAAKSLSVSKEWREKHDDLSAEYKVLQETADKDKATLVAEKQQIEAARTALVGERDDFKDEVDRLKGQVADEERKNNEMRGDVAKFAASIDNLTAQSKQYAEARDAAKQAQMDAEKARDAAVAAQAAAEARMGELETSLHASEGKVADLEKANTALKKDVDSLQTNFDSLAQYTGVSVNDFQAMPQIEGRVLDVAMNVQPGLIAINKGNADGVKRGFTFEIYDGRTYKGQARVEYVHENVCSALLVRAVEGQPIRQGDSASTRL